MYVNNVIGMILSDFVTSKIKKNITEKSDIIAVKKRKKEEELAL